MKLIKIPNIIKKIYKSAIWTIPNEKNEIYLTIDDCSDEETTLEVLDILENHQVKATFFCIGKYVEENNLHKKIIKEGHGIGNHGYEHLNGLKTDYDKYISNVFNCASIIDSDLFRPPYGKISIKQLKKLSQSFKIIMWDVLSYDFDEKTTPIECLENVKSNIESGSIIVFHANKKSQKNILFALPVFLEYIKTTKFNFSVIKSERLS